ncbi:helix-turn-helix domain-containing protein [Cohnella boryungensis]|uniref:Helix-turn-helix domain-containing protein n=1 Tax=Cohnella boryungensis TaxID=768479 RepID=A0ABV8S5E2_9BACL
MTIWPTRKPRENKLFGKFLLSYFFVLLIPLTVGFYAYNQTVQVVREDAAQLNLTVLEQSEEALNRLLSEIRDTVALLSLDSEVLNLMITAEPSWSAESLYRFAQLQRNELSLLSTNQFFSGLFVYFRQSDAVISRNEIERMATSTLSVGGAPFRQWLDGVISDGRTNQFLRLEDVRSGRSPGNYLAYVSALPEGNKKHVDGAIIILIDEQTIVSLFKRLVVDEGAFAHILNDRQEVIVSTAKGASAEAIAEITQNGSRPVIDGTEMFLTTKRSPASGWTYQVGLPADAVFSKAEYIKRINWMFAAIVLVVGCLFALLLAYRNSKPIADLVGAIKEFAGGDHSADRRGSEMDLLKSTFYKMMSDNKLMNVRMGQQLPMLQSACFERLLKSGFNSEREMSSYLDQAQITLAEGTVGAAVIKLHQSDFAVGEEGAEQIRLLRVLSQQLSEVCHVHDLKAGRLAALFSFPGTASEERMNSFLIRLEELQRKLLGEYGLAASIGVGQMYSSGMDLWRSYNEACQALDVQDPDVSMKPICFGSISRQSGHYYYPLDIEHKLIHNIKTGDTEGLERLLEHLELENFQRRQLSVWRARQLYSEIEGTMQKLSEQVQFSPETPGASHKFPDNLSDDTELDFRPIKEKLLAICDGIRQQRSAKHQSTLQNMKAYILANYTDNNLSLCALANEFKQAESTVSTFFKEYMGVAFSEYLEQLRLDEARVLLKGSQLPIQEIAIRVGYSSDKSFRRAFKRSFGVQPTSYRNNLEVAAGS